jgi:hypothetical protein
MSDATAYLAIIFYNEKVVDRRIAQCLLGQLVTRGREIQLEERTAAVMPAIPAPL